MGSPSARFCGGCGAARSQDTGGHGAIDRRAGELKHATVLFADIVSSTEHIADLDPEQAMEQLQPAVVQMCDAIQKFGGTVLRTLGDGVMAMFGLPRALEDHAQLACQAALSMQQAFRVGQHDLAIRVGLHSGVIASDPAGHGAHGLVIHVASRVVSLAGPGGICLTQQCLGLLRGGANTRKMGPRLLKGLREPIEIHVLEGLRQSRAPHPSQRKALSPFFGRGAELALLDQALRLTQMGDAQIVGICGAPGSGKSRLCHEFAAACRSQTLPIYQVKAQPYGHATPLQPVLEILRAYLFKIPPQSDAAFARGQISLRLSELGSPDPAESNLLNDFLGVPEPEMSLSGPGLDPKARRSRLLSIFARLIRECAPAPAVILLEDLHWLDEASEELLLSLLQSLKGTRTLVLLNYRPRFAAAWERLANFQHIELRELSAEDTAQLVRSLISQRDEFSSVCRLVVERSAGNPFFAEELVRSIAQGHLSSGDGSAIGAWFESISEALPETVQAVIAARIDRLGDDQKRLLQVCAIIGKEVPLEVLERVAQAEVDDITGSLAALCRLEFLQVSADAANQFGFGHPLIQEVAYGMQLRATRSAIHALVAQAMESHYQDRLDEYSGLIGHHYQAAGQMLLAARHIARAATWLSSANTASAIKQWQRVQDVLKQLGRAEEVDQLRMMASSRIAMLGWREGHALHEVQPYIDEAKALAAEVDSRLTQLLLIVEGRMLQAGGASADEYVDRATTALTLVEPTDVGRRAMVNAALCHAYGRAGLLAEALAANEVAWRDVASIDRFDREFVGFGVEHWILAMRGRSLARGGKLDEARLVWQEMLQSGAIDPTVEAIPHLGYVEFAWCVGDAELARTEAERIVELAGRSGIPYIRVIAALCTGVAASMAGDLQAALPALTAGLSLVRANRVAMEFEAEILAAIAECEAQTGELEQAHAHAAQAMELSRTRGMRIAECRAIIIQGVLAGLAGGVPQECFDRAERLIEETGAITYRAPLQRARQQVQPRELRIS
jgi:class 3 adenylate cyclase